MGRAGQNGKDAAQRLLIAVGGLPGLLVVVGSALVGVLIGIMVFTFGYANGLAYFGDEATTCKQCHSMNKQFDAWSKGSHHTLACQECHSPEKSTLPVQWLVSEADNGFWHSLKFTTGDYPLNIKIRDHNVDIVRVNCLRCHGNLVSQVEQPALHSSSQIDCLRCHSEVGHKR